MKTKAFGVILALCLAAGLMGVMSGCNNDEDDDLLDGNDGIFEELLKEDMTHFEEDGIKGIIFNYSIIGKEVEGGNGSQFEYCEDQPIGAIFLARYVEKNDLRDRLDGGDVIADKGFMAVYNEKGKLVRRIDFNKIEVTTLLVGVIGYPEATCREYGYVWLNKKGQSVLPPGKYVSQFTIQYNATPGTGTKTMKPLTFRKSFEIVRTK
jgi:hypothetical protein